MIMMEWNSEREPRDRDRDGRDRDRDRERDRDRDSRRARAGVVPINGASTSSGTLYFHSSFFDN